MFDRSKKTGTRNQTIYTFCACESRRDLWTGAYDGTFQNCAGAYVQNHGGFGDRKRRRLAHSIAGQYPNGNRQYGIFREHSIVGGHAHRRFVHNDFVVHYDNDGLRAIF